eukprot:6456489-Amphidinium_carterae.1
MCLQSAKSREVREVGALLAHSCVVLLPLYIAAFVLATTIAPDLPSRKCFCELCNARFFLGVLDKSQR